MNFTAFKNERSRFSAKRIALIGYGVPFLYAGLFLLNRGVALLVFAILFVGFFIGSIALIVWFIYRLAVRRKNTALRAIETINRLQQFADDNHLSYTSYPGETVAPESLYAHVYSPEKSRGTIFIRNAVSGDVLGTKVLLYELIIEVPRTYGQGPGSYIYSRGRPAVIETILSVDRPVRPWYKGPITASNAPNGFIMVEGVVSDQATIKRMFKMAGF